MSTPRQQIERRAVTLGKASRFELPPFPRLPERLLRDYPELRQTQAELLSWQERLNTALSNMNDLTQ